MAARFAWGLLNGNVGVVKTMLSDVCPDEHTARAFSFIGIAVGVGRIIGPTIGGILAEPATKYPSVFGNAAVLRMFPYALPCCLGALLSLSTFVVAAVVLQETRGLAAAEQDAVDAERALLRGAPDVSEMHRQHTIAGDLEGDSESYVPATGRPLASDPSAAVHSAQTARLVDASSRASNMDLPSSIRDASLSTPVAHLAVPVGVDVHDDERKPLQQLGSIAAGVAPHSLGRFAGTSAHALPLPSDRVGRPRPHHRK